MSPEIRSDHEGPRFAGRLAGGPRDIGRALGVLGRPAWNAFATASPLWRDLQRWRGTAHLAALADHTRTLFPRCWEEIAGLAEGLGVAVEDAFLWNCRGDLVNRTADGCTSVAVRGGAVNWLAHNEDGDPAFEASWRLVEVRPEGAPGFVGFVYPGSIPGHTFAATGAGLVQTVNNLRSTVRRAGVPRMVLGRALLDAPSLDAAVDLLASASHAGGFHHLLAQAGDDRIFSVEAMPEGCSVIAVAARYGHANHAVHDHAAPDRAAPGRADTVAQIVTASSRDRQARIAALLAGPAPVADEAGLHDLLADRGGPGLPIHRRAADDPDGENTLATAVFRIAGRTIRLSVCDGRAAAAGDAEITA